MKSTLMLLMLSIFAFDDLWVPAAEAGILTRNQRSITSRFRRRPRMHLSTRYLTSAKVLRRTNPSLKTRSDSLSTSKQIQVQQQAENEWQKKYSVWRKQQYKAQLQAIKTEKKEQYAHLLRLKRTRESEQRKAKTAESIREAPLNPWSRSKNAQETGVIDLKNEKENSKPKDATRRTPLLKQLWQAIFG